MRKTGIYLLSLFFILNCNSVLAQNGSVSINTKVDTTIATIGDHIHFTITLNYPEKTRFQFPEFKESLGKFSLINQNFSQPEKTTYGFTKDINLTITIFDTGKVEIPSLTINAISASDTNEVLKFQTEPHYINVITVLPPEKVEPKDIKPPFPIRKLIPWDIFLFIFIIILIITFWFFYNKKWKQTHPRVIYDEKYLDPPHIVALRKLKIINQGKYFSNTEKIEYFVSVSQIFREYLERQFFIRALEMSTTDIMESLKIINLDNMNIIKINALFNKLDIVKFANQLPVLEDKENVYDNTFNLINVTKTEHFLSQRSGLTDIKEDFQDLSQE